MQRLKKWSLLLLVLTIYKPLHAHPVAFKGSRGVMGYHSPYLTHNQINYSFQHWMAVGVHHVTRPNLKVDNSATFATSNFLLKRWNGEKLQANIYLNLGLGQSQISGDHKPAAYGLLQFDIEDRDYYFLSKHIELHTENLVDLKQTVVRAGFTPYVENFNGLHSWLILEYQNAEFSESQVVEDLTPFLRIFYRNLLFELGQSFKGTTKFNYIVHF